MECSECEQKKEILICGLCRKRFCWRHYVEHLDQKKCSRMELLELERRKRVDHWLEVLEERVTKLEVENAELKERFERFKRGMDNIVEAYKLY